MHPIRLKPEERVDLPEYGDPSPAALLGLLETISYRYSRALRLSDPVKQAIAEGWCFDADPCWEYADATNVRPYGLPSKIGAAWLEDHGYICACPTCNRLAMPDHYCGLCAYGTTGGYIGLECNFHWTGRNRWVVDKRRKQKDSSYLPDEARAIHCDRPPSPEEVAAIRTLSNADAQTCTAFPTRTSDPESAHEDAP